MFLADGSAAWRDRASTIISVLLTHLLVLCSWCGYMGTLSGKLARSMSRSSSGRVLKFYFPEVPAPSTPKMDAIKISSLESFQKKGHKCCSTGLYPDGSSKGRQYQICTHHVKCDGRTTAVTCFIRRQYNYPWPVHM